MNPQMMDSPSRVPKKPWAGCCGQEERNPSVGTRGQGPVSVLGAEGLGKQPWPGSHGLWWQIWPYPEPASLFPPPRSPVGPRLAAAQTQLPPWGDTFSPVPGCPRLLPGAAQAHTNPSGQEFLPKTPQSREMLRAVPSRGGTRRMPGRAGMLQGCSRPLPCVCPARSEGVAVTRVSKEC